MIRSSGSSWNLVTSTSNPGRVGYLVDTNVISEVTRLRPEQSVLKWLDLIPADGLYLSVITVGEISKGIARLGRVDSDDARTKADGLQGWLEGLMSDYADRIIHVNVPIAARWGRLCSTHPQLSTDMLLAATALDRGLTVATRNVQHFRVAGVAVVNPFEAIG
jgi:toxin FitB